MKKITISILSSFILLSLAFTACKSKPKDADIQISVENAFKTDPSTSGAMVSVTKGVATISGVCNDEAAKSRAGELAKGIKGVKEVVNNCTVNQPPVDMVVNADDEALNKGLTDALKDNPGVQYSINNGKIVLTGEIKKSRWMSLKQTLDKLKSKGYELSGLKIN